MSPYEVVFPQSIRAVFLDMDHTLISTDCDVTWKEFLVSKGFGKWTDVFLKSWHYFQYRRDRLNIDSFMKFQLREFRGKTLKEMEGLALEHFEQVIRPAVYPEVKDWIVSLQKQGLLTILCTATNEVIARPLFEYLKPDHFIATRLEMKEGYYTGRFLPPYVGGVNKLKLMKEWLETKGLKLSQASYWGDSRSDIPVIQGVGFGVAANPQRILREYAEEQGWPVVFFGTNQGGWK